MEQMKETPVDLNNLRSEIEGLHGQMRFMRAAIAALVLADSSDAFEIQLRITQSDLMASFLRQPANPDEARQLRRWKAGAESAARDLHAMIHT